MNLARCWGARQKNTKNAPEGEGDSSAEAAGEELGTRVSRAVADSAERVEVAVAVKVRTSEAEARGDVEARGEPLSEGEGEGLQCECARARVCGCEWVL